MNTAVLEGLTSLSKEQLGSFGKLRTAEGEGLTVYAEGPGNPNPEQTFESFFQESFSSQSEILIQLNLNAVASGGRHKCP